MFPCRYGRRNVVNRCSVVEQLTRVPRCFPVDGFGGGLLVQILGSGRGGGSGVVGVGDKPSAY